MAQQVYTPVTPAALGATIYAPALIALWVGVAGALKIRGFKDTSVVTLPSVPVGLLALPYPVQEVVASAALTGTVSVTNGLTTITFSVAQTLPQGAALVFSNQLGTVYYLAAAVNGSTAGTLTVAFSGTTAGADTVTEGTTASGLVGVQAGS